MSPDRHPVITAFSNRYGALSLELVTDFQPVKQIHGRGIPDAYKFDTATAEQIALITDNRSVQMSPGWPIVEGGWYLLVHDSCSTAAVARVKSLDYTGPASPSAEIQRCATPAFL